ncbi:hypothetical protein [Aerococcus agrisoli]|nr:hypothetical protein [Aerococcus agrisoli]
MKKSLFDIIGFKSKYSYEESLEFSTNRTLYQLFFRTYYEHLSRAGLELEEVFASCYNELFNEEYLAEGFSYNVSPAELKFYDKCKLIIPEMDSVLKQYDFYRKFKEIDPELLEIASKNPAYDELKSLQEKKNIYFNSKKVEFISDLLFRTDFFKSLEGESLYYHVSKGITRKAFTFEMDETRLDYLEENNIISYTREKEIYFNNPKLLRIYQLIKNYGYCDIIYFTKDLMVIVDKDIEEGNLKYDNYLFSKQEIDYISYIMDKKRFGNSLDIRNKYIHGSKAKVSDEEHKENYLELMIILLLYTYKINQELDFEERSNKL